MRREGCPAEIHTFRETISAALFKYLFMSPEVSAVIGGSLAMTRDRSSRPCAAAVLGVLAVLTFAVPLQAYADPGSGLLVYQITAAFFLGAVFQLRKLLTRLWKLK